MGRHVFFAEAAALAEDECNDQRGDACVSLGGWRPIVGVIGEPGVGSFHLAGRSHPVTGVPFDPDGFLRAYRPSNRQRAMR